MKTRIAICLALALPSSVWAEDESGFLFGLGGGRANVQADAIGFDEDSTAWKVFGGYRINENFSVEASYIDAGEAEATLDSITASVEGEVTQLALLGGWWFTPSVGAYVRLSENLYDATVRASGPGGSIVVSEDGDEIGYGAGLQGVWDAALLRLEYEAVDIAETEVSLLTLSIAWRF